MNFEDPLFHIHLNVDFPFNLTGILYFPKLKKQMDLQKNRIHLYSNQVFITDNVENIVPDFLTLLHGVIDSPDIPLNVSRSYLQEDANVKKISGHISKKVSDKLAQMFKKDREAFEASGTTCACSWSTACSPTRSSPSAPRSSSSTRTRPASATRTRS